MANSISKERLREVLSHAAYVEAAKKHHGNFARAS